MLHNKTQRRIITAYPEIIAWN